MELRDTRIEEPVLHALADADQWLRYQGLHNRAEFKTVPSLSIGVAGRSDGGGNSRPGSGGLAPHRANYANELLEFDGGIEMRMPAVTRGCGPHPSG